MSYDVRYICMARSTPCDTVFHYFFSVLFLKYYVLLKRQSLNQVFCLKVFSQLKQLSLLYPFNH